MFAKYYHHVRIYEIMNAPKSGRFAFSGNEVSKYEIFGNLVYVVFV